MGLQDRPATEAAGPRFLFRRDAWLLLSSNGIYSVGFSAFTLLFAVYLKDSGFGEDKVGLLRGILRLGSGVGSLALIGFIGRRPLRYSLALFCALFGLFSMVLSVAGGFVVLFVVSILTGFVFSGYRVPMVPMYAESSSVYERSRLILAGFAVGILLTAIVYFISGSLVAAAQELTGSAIWGYRAVFLTASSVIILGAVPCIFIRGKDGASGRPRGATRASAGAGGVTGRDWPLIARGLILQVMSTGTTGMILAFQALILRDHVGIDLTNVCRIVAVGLLLAFFFNISVAPFFVERLGRRRMIAAYFLLLAPSLALVGYAPAVWMKVAGIYGFLVCAFALTPSVADLNVDLVGEKDRVFMNGIRMAALHTAWFVGSTAAGFIIFRYGYEEFFIVPISISVAAAVYVFLFLRKIKTTTQRAREPLEIIT